MRGKVLLLLDDFRYAGGGEILLARIADMLHGQGVDVVVGTLLDDPSAPNLGPIPVISFGLNRHGPIMTVNCLRRYIRDADVGVIEAFHLKAAFYASFSKIGHEIPVIWTINGHYMPSQRRQTLKSWKLLAVTRWLGWTLDAAICISEDLECFLGRTGFPRRKLIRINNGVPITFATRCTDDSRAHYRALLGLDSEHLSVIGIVSRVVAFKGHAVLLDALRIVQDQGRKTALLVVGTGEALDSVQEHAAKTVRNVAFLGHRSDVPEILSACDVVVLPTVSSEGAPLAVIEAMACGRAVIVTDAGGMPEMVCHGESGIVVPKGDPIALANALKELIDHADHRKCLGSVAKQRYMMHYTLEASVQGRLRLYERLSESTVPD